MAAADIGEQVGQKVLPSMRRVPEVMMRINDWQVGSSGASVGRFASHALKSASFR